MRDECLEHAQLAKAATRPPPPPICDCYCDSDCNCVRKCSAFARLLLSICRAAPLRLLEICSARSRSDATRLFDIVEASTTSKNCSTVSRYRCQSLVSQWEISARLRSSLGIEPCCRQCISRRMWMPVSVAPRCAVVADVKRHPRLGGHLAKSITLAPAQAPRPRRYAQRLQTFVGARRCRSMRLDFGRISSRYRNQDRCSARRVNPAPFCAAYFAAIGPALCSGAATKTLNCWCVGFHTIG